MANSWHVTLSCVKYRFFFLSVFNVVALYFYVSSKSLITSRFRKSPKQNILHNISHHADSRTKIRISRKVISSKKCHGNADPFKFLSPWVSSKFWKYPSDLWPVIPDGRAHKEISVMPKLFFASYTWNIHLW
jgi:hypothetical protein